MRRLWVSLFRFRTVIYCSWPTTYKYERTSDGFMVFLPFFSRLTKMHTDFIFWSIWYQNVCTTFVFIQKVKNVTWKYTHLHFGVVEQVKGQYIRKGLSRKRYTKHEPISKAEHTHTHTTHSYYQSCINSLKIHARQT